MSTKFRILVVLASLSITLSLMSNTYSRYVADTTGNVEVFFTNWQILVNETDITNSTTSEIDLTPVIEENANVANNKFAPSSKGYFDIVIDSSNVELSYEYIITLATLNENMPDLMITKYSIIDSNYVEGNELEINSIVDNIITGTLNYNNAIENFKFEPFTIRIYFEWYEGEDEQMDDEADTNIGTHASENTLRISANIKFQQKLGDTSSQEQQETTE